MYPPEFSRFTKPWRTGGLRTHGTDGESALPIWKERMTQPPRWNFFQALSGWARRSAMAKTAAG
jgi:hypothetical protein